MIRAFHLDFYVNAAGKQPCDLELFRLADRFAKEQLAEPLDLAQAQQAWIVCRCEDDKPVEVLAMGGLQSIVDCFLFRVKPSAHESKATKVLWDRMNAFCGDQGLRGQNVLLHISSKDTPQQRCPNADEWLKNAEAEPADRYTVKVK